MRYIFYILLLTFGATCGFMAIIQGETYVMTDVGFGVCLLNILAAFDIIINKRR